MDSEGFGIVAPGGFREGRGICLTGKNPVTLCLTGRNPALQAGKLPFRQESCLSGKIAALRAARSNNLLLSLGPSRHLLCYRRRARKYPPLQLPRAKLALCGTGAKRSSPPPLSPPGDKAQPLTILQSIHHTLMDILDDNTCPPTVSGGSASPTDPPDTVGVQVIVVVGYPQG